MAFGINDRTGSVFVGNKIFNNQMFTEALNFYSNYTSTAIRTNANGNIPDTNATSVAVQRGV
ncbi:MAG TPA: hypothetical protein PK317_01840 [Coprothermobacter proteolyticus]|nr:hypothetical protein [Coprothermobacter proteolyticus]